MAGEMNDAQIYRAALNNELIRLVWAGYKEQYISFDEGIFFTVRDSEGTSSQIRSWKEAQILLYDQKIKSNLALTGVFHDQEIELEDSRTLLNALLPYFLKSYPEISFSEERWEYWLKVSRDSVENEALAIADKMAFDHAIAPHGSVTDYAFTQGTGRSFAFFNRYAAYFGRYDMPFSKMKLPIENKNALVHAPEFGNDVPIVLAALNRRHAAINSLVSVDINRVIRDEFPEIFVRWEDVLRKSGKDPLDYVVLPIHPLTLGMYEAAQGALLKSNDLMIDLGISIRAKASLSYRTMIPGDGESRIMIKLPVPLQLTGSIRHIEFTELKVAPQLSEILAGIFAGEKNFGNRIRLDRELATISVIPDPAVPECPDMRYFSCLIRENAGRDFPSTAISMPLAALFAGSFKSRRPVLVELMERAGVTTPAQAVHYFENYLDITLRSLLPLYLRHGIMLEAHQQNLGISFNETGNIETLHYQDIGYAVYIYKPVYERAGHSDEIFSSLPYPYLSEKFEVSAFQFVHTTLVLNLLPVVDVIEHHFHSPKEHLLGMIADNIILILREEKQSMRSASGADVSHVEFCDDFINYVLVSPNWRVKKLLGRMFKQSQTARWGKIPNDDPDFLAAKVTGASIENPLHSWMAGKSPAVSP